MNVQSVQRHKEAKAPRLTWKHKPQEARHWAIEMFHQIKAPAAEAEAFSSVPETHVVKRENRLAHVVL